MKKQCTRFVQGESYNTMRRVWFELVIEVIAFCVLAVAIVFLWRQNGLLLLAMIGITLAVLFLWHRRRDVFFFVIIAVLGSIAEAVFVHFDVWRYANPSVFGVPIWFPLAFGSAALIGLRLVSTVCTIWEIVATTRHAKP